MKIALDYDGTFTEDSGLWCRFIDEATVNHQVYLVTYRGIDTPINYIHDEIDAAINKVMQMEFVYSKE